MNGASVDLQLATLRPAEPVLGEHAEDGAANGISGLAAHRLSVGTAGETTGVARVTMNELGVSLTRTQHDFGGVNHNHMVAGVDMGREDRLVLTPQDTSDLGSHTAERHAFSVDNVPVALNISWFGRKGLHESPSREKTGQIGARRFERRLIKPTAQLTVNMSRPLPNGRKKLATLDADLMGVPQCTESAVGSPGPQRLGYSAAMQPDQQMPLSHLRVIDLTIARAGPTCVRQLADWGADVIRIEPPATGADLSGGSRSGPDFQNLHRNKRAIVLDLKTPEGIEVFFDLVKTADVVVENMRANVKHRLGIAYDNCAAVNPRIVYASISGFGQDGPYGHRAGVDQIAQGLGGLMSVTGVPGQGPVRVGVPIADLASGMYLAMGVMLAIINRDRPGSNGKGQWVHTSLLEAQIAMLDFQATRWTMDGEVPPQAGNHHPTGIPMGTFPSSDGLVNIAAPGGAMWRNFAELIGASHLLDDERYRRAAGRSQHRDRLNAEISRHTAQQPTAHWVEVLNEAGIPCGPVLSIDETFADPQVQHLQMTQTVEHPHRGPIDIIRNAVNLTGTPRQAATVAPERGQHTVPVLEELGYEMARIDQLRQAGVVEADSPQSPPT